jgi:hypothetical protein
MEVGCGDEWGAEGEGTSQQLLNYLKLRLMVRWSASVGFGLPSEAHDQILFCITIACFLITMTSLTRRWVCNLLVKLLLSLARAVTTQVQITHYILQSHLRLSQPGGPGPRNCIPKEQGGPVIPPSAGFPFCGLLWLPGVQCRYSNPRLHWATDVQVQVILRPTVRQWPDFNFLFVWQFLSSSNRLPPLTRGRVCNLQCNHSLVRVAQNS